MVQLNSPIISFNNSASVSLALAAYLLIIRWFSNLLIFIHLLFCPEAEDCICFSFILLCAEFNRGVQPGVSYQKRILVINSYCFEELVGKFETLMNFCACLICQINGAGIIGQEKYLLWMRNHAEPCGCIAARF